MAVLADIVKQSAVVMADSNPTFFKWFCNCCERKTLFQNTVVF